MRVLVISNMFPGPSSPAFGTFVRNQVEDLKAAGLDLTVAANNNPRTGKINVLKKHLIWGASSLARFAKPYDLVHAHYAFPSGGLARWLSRLRRTPYIVTVHGGDLDKMARKGRFFNKQTRLILRDAAHVITVGPALYHDVVHTYNIPEARVSLLNMGVNREIFYPRNNNQVPPFRKEAGEKHLLFVGNLVKEKGVEELLAAASVLRRNGENIHLHLVGPAKQREYEQKLHTYAATLQLHDMTYFHGPKPQDEVARFMSHADLFVLPSHMEGFGLVALEAMACGTPVVASRVGGLPYLLSEGAGTLAAPKDIASLTSAIQRSLTHSARLKNQINTGFQQANRFDAKRIIQNVVTLYDKVVKEYPSP